jgi:hypothetical protein
MKSIALLFVQWGALRVSICTSRLAVFVAELAKDDEFGAEAFTHPKWPGRVLHGKARDEELFNSQT